MAQIESARERVAPAVAGVLVIVAAIAVAWAVVRLAWLIVSGPAVASAPLPEVPRRTVAATPQHAEWRLFGEAAEAAPPPAPATSLALELRGVVSGANGYAVIADARGEEAVYRVDDELPGNARVTAIGDREVEIRRDGRREVLAMPAPDGRDDGPDGPRPAQRSDRTDDGASGLSVASFAGIEGALPGAGAVADDIRTLPVPGGGFRLRPGRDAVRFTRLGFQANDVVLAVNGRPVEDAADVMAVFRDMEPGERLAVRIRRDGREMTVTPDLAAVHRSQESQ